MRLFGQISNTVETKAYMSLFGSFQTYFCVIILDAINDSVDGVKVIHAKNSANVNFPLTF